MISTLPGGLHSSELVSLLKFSLTLRIAFFHQFRSFPVIFLYGYLPMLFLPEKLFSLYLSAYIGIIAQVICIMIDFLFVVCYYYVATTREQHHQSTTITKSSRENRHLSEKYKDSPKYCKLASFRNTAKNTQMYFSIQMFTEFRSYIFKKLF